MRAAFGTITMVSLKSQRQRRAPTDLSGDGDVEQRARRASIDNKHHGDGGRRRVERSGGIARRRRLLGAGRHGNTVEPQRACKEANISGPQQKRNRAQCKTKDKRYRQPTLTARQLPVREDLADRDQCATSTGERAHAPRQTRMCRRGSASGATRNERNASTNMYVSA